MSQQLFQEYFLNRFLRRMESKRVKLFTCMQFYEDRSARETNGHVPEHYRKHPLEMKQITEEASKLYLRTNTQTGEKN